MLVVDRPIGANISLSEHVNIFYKFAKDLLLAFLKETTHTYRLKNSIKADFPVTAL